MARTTLFLSLLKSPSLVLAPRRLSTLTPSTSPLPDSEAGVLELRKLEEAIHTIYVNKSMPDWLVFMPGSSFLVPPREKRVDMADLMYKLMNHPSSEQEPPVPLTRGGRGCWPSFELLAQKDDAAVPALDLEEEVIKDRESGCGDSEG